jgi:hypothetical protein
MTSDTRNMEKEKRKKRRKKHHLKISTNDYQYQLI